MKFTTSSNRVRSILNVKIVITFFQSHSGLDRVSSTCNRIVLDIQMQFLYKQTMISTDSCIFPVVSLTRHIGIWSINYSLQMFKYITQ